MCSLQGIVFTHQTYLFPTDTSRKLFITPTNNILFIKIFHFRFSVRLGEWNLSTVLDCADKKNCIYEPVQDIRIEQIITNNDYDISDESMHNDIAILRIARRATYNYFVRPICLPILEKLHITSLADGVRFTVAGWLEPRPT
jgi:hypothetical protein